MFSLLALGAALSWLYYNSTRPKIRNVRIGPVSILPPEVSGMRYNTMSGFDWKVVSTLAKQYGPAAAKMVATYYPPAAVAMTAVSQLQSKAKAGDPRAIAKVSEIAAKAQAGNPTAVVAVKAMANLSRMKNPEPQPQEEESSEEE
jgi:hypothetical protein